jgi:hypothetical protein
MSYVIQASDGRFMKTTAAVQLLATGQFWICASVMLDDTK